MIWSMLRRVAAVLFGFILAVIGATVTLFMLGAHWAAGEVTAYAPDNADEISQTLNEWLGVVAFFLTVAPVMTLLPALAVVAAGEIARVRSVLYYILGGGIAAAVMPVIMAPPEVAASPSYSAQYFAIIATAGFVGGLVYWLVTGRNA
jgi:hypothetical protein